MNFDALQIEIKRSCVRGQIGDTKTAAGAKPVPLLPQVAAALREWKKVTLYSGPGDFVFASVRAKGEVPVWPDMVLKKTIRPAAEGAGIRGKVIGWHTFRHSHATNLRSLGVDVKTAQELLRHANSRITLDLYTQAISENKREAIEMVGRLVLSSIPTSQHPSASSDSEKIAVASVKATTYLTDCEYSANIEASCKRSRP